MNNQFTDSYMSVKDLCAYLNVARSTIYRWQALGMFPKSICLGCRTARWKKSDIDKWLANKEIES